VLRYQGKYEAAERMNQRALEGYKISLGGKHPLTLKSTSSLVLALMLQGKYGITEQMERWALERSESTLGKQHPDTLSSVSNLGAVLFGQGKYDDARLLTLLSVSA